MRENCEDQTVSLQMIQTTDPSEKAVIVKTTAGVNINELLVTNSLATRKRPNLGSPLSHNTMPELKQ